MSTYDILLDAPATRPAMLERARAAAVTPLRHAAPTRCSGADLVISAVTASSSRDVARDAAPWLAPGQLFLDVNSVSPETKRGNARAVEASGADYVEAAVMAPVPPQRLAVPMLLGGRRARRARRGPEGVRHERDGRSPTRSEPPRRSRCAAAS